ncbi:hypothetical protein B0J11DRAFT_437329 [Dendryphion nanum]|uniref:Uncharacterized protein n=1 Tax=Dendryphion nanum TaxID=256645 RepID=A0A9P9IKK5_9PLEO|nr:hypothetical protein B0J11DRAFT_437329 [Dendryphion nanum]
MDQPPPPYSEADSSRVFVPAPRRRILEQFGRYIIELMAFTFDADFTTLNNALGQSPNSISASHSILDDDEKAELLRLALISKDLYKRLGETRWDNSQESDREALAENIVKPALLLRLCEGYIMDILSAYANHRCDKTKRNETTISRETPRPVWIVGFWMLDLVVFGRHLRAHEHIIAAVCAGRKPLYMALDDAMKPFFRKEYGKEKDWCKPFTHWPTGYQTWNNLGEDLVPLRYRGIIEAHGIRLREEAAREKGRYDASRDTFAT